jgi:hypothetical protein
MRRCFNRAHPPPPQPPPQPSYQPLPQPQVKHVGEHENRGVHGQGGGKSTSAGYDSRTRCYYFRRWISGSVV